MNRYRVIQWATGAMGKTCLKAIIDHPGVELVALFVYGAGKVGKDAGEIARRNPTGIIATNDVDAILACDADVVIHAGRLAPPYGSHDGEIIRLLESGKNVISINGYSFTQHSQGERLARLEDACAKGGVSLMNAGLNPGFIAEQIAVVATGVCSELDSIEVIESVSGREIMQPAYAFDALGFGADIARSDPMDEDWGPACALNGMYEEVVGAVANRLGMKLDRIERDHRVYASTADLHVNAGVVQTIVMLEGIGLQLDPDFDVFQAAEPHMQRLMKNLFMPNSGWARNVLMDATNWGEMLHRLPRVGNRMLERLERNEPFKMEIKDTDRLLSKLDRLVTRLSLSLLVAAFVVVLPLLIPLTSPDSLPRWILLIGMVPIIGTGVWLGLSLLNTPKNK